MKKLIEAMDRIEECGMSEMDDMPAMAPPTNPGNPVTMSVSLNASGKEHVADLLDMMKNAGMPAAGPVAAKMLSPRMDMERLAGIMDDPSIPGRDDVPDDQDVDSSYDNPNFSDTVKAMGGGKIAPLPTSQRKEPTIAKPTLQLTPDMRVGEEGDDDYDHIESADGGFGDATTEPDPQYGDMSDAIPNGNDLNRKKGSYKAVSGGDNPMQYKIEVESIKKALYAALTEKKMPMGAGPDGKKGTGDDKPAFLNQKGDSKKKKGGKPKKGVNPFK